MRRYASIGNETTKNKHKDTADTSQDNGERTRPRNLQIGGCPGLKNITQAVKRLYTVIDVTARSTSGQRCINDAKIKTENNMKAREQRQNEDKEYMIIANTMSVVYNRARGNENPAAVQLVWARNKL